MMAATKPNNERQKPVRKPYPHYSAVERSCALAKARRQRVVISLGRLVMSWFKNNYSSTVELINVISYIFITKIDVFV